MPDLHYTYISFSDKFKYESFLMYTFYDGHSYDILSKMATKMSAAMAYFSLFGLLLNYFWTNCFLFSFMIYAHQYLNQLC